jgi:hypothetical protein
MPQAKERPSRIVFEDSTEVEKHVVYGSAFHVSSYCMRNDRKVYLRWHSGLNCFYPKDMSLDKVRQICGY